LVEIKHKDLFIKIIYNLSFWIPSLAPNLRLISGAKEGTQKSKAGGCGGR
jgi:hypothetical protein